MSTHRAATRKPTSTSEQLPLGDTKKRESPLRVLIKSGDDLEYRVARLLVYEGYAVRRGRELYTVGRLDQATDLDVLAFRWNSALQRETLICECKSGGEGALDRVFWLAGVKSYTRASHAVLARRETRWNIKDFAKEAGIEIAGPDSLREREERCGVPSDRFPGAIDKHFIEANASAWNDALAKDSWLSELCAALLGETRFTGNFGALNYLIHHGRLLVRHLENGPQSTESLTRFLLSEACVQIAVHLVTIVASTRDLGMADRRRMCEKRLKYGELDPALADRIFATAGQLAGQVIQEHLGTVEKIDTAMFSMPAPDYVEAICKEVESMAAAGRLTAVLVPVLDVALFDCFAKGKDAADISSICRSSGIEFSAAELARFTEFLIELGCLPSRVRGLEKICR